MDQNSSSNRKGGEGSWRERTKENRRWEEEDGGRSSERRRKWSTSRRSTNSLIKITVTIRMAMPCQLLVGKIIWHAMGRSAFQGVLWVLNGMDTANGFPGLKLGLALLYPHEIESLTRRVFSGTDIVDIVNTIKVESWIEFVWWNVKCSHVIGFFGDYKSDDALRWKPCERH